MCLVSANKPIKKIAEEDIICYKVVKNDLTSPVYNFKYEVGKSYVSELDEPVEKPYHYDSECSASVAWFVENGLHTFADNYIANPATYMYSAERWRSLSGKIVLANTVLKCVIPKGAEYYEGICCFLKSELHSYASNQLKVITVL